MKQQIFGSKAGFVVPSTDETTPVKNTTHKKKVSSFKKVKRRNPSGSEVKFNLDLMNATCHNRSNTTKEFHLQNQF